MAEVTGDDVDNMCKEWGKLIDKFNELLLTKAQLGDGDSKVTSLADLKTVASDAKTTAEGKLEKGELIDRDNKKIETMSQCFDRLVPSISEITITHRKKIIWIDDPSSKSGAYWDGWMKPSIRGASASQYNFSIGISGASFALFGAVVSLTGFYGAGTGVSIWSRTLASPGNGLASRLKSMKTVLEGVGNEIAAAAVRTVTTELNNGVTITEVVPIEIGAGLNVNN